MDKSGREREIQSLLSDYKSYRKIAKSSLKPNHAYYEDFLKVIEMCNQKIELLERDLEILRSK